MTTKIRFFGPLEEVVGFPESQMEITLPQSEASMRQAINDLFPPLRGEFFRIAVDEEMISEGAVIGDAREIACLPPFAGG